jgi:Uncharacterized conserved protein, contains double-stranded beta-helix domain
MPEKQQTKLATPMRRVVTGHDEQGRAIIVEDGPVPVVKTDPNRPGYAVHQIWKTESAPARIDNGSDPTLQPMTLTPPTNGTVIRMIEFPPASQELKEISPEQAAKVFGMYGQSNVLTGKRGKQRHPFMHRTETVDYAVVLSGEIVMLLDDSEVTLKAGECLIQRGTNHAWTNRSDQPCRMLFVLVDGEFDPSIKQAIDTFDARPV